MPFDFDIETIRWVVLSFFSGSAIMGLFNLNLFLFHKKLYLKKWMYFWFIVAINYLILYLGFYYQNVTYFGIYFVLIIVSSFFFYQGSSIFLNTKINKKVYPTLAFLISLTILSTIFSDWIGWGVVLSYWTFSIFLFYIGRLYIIQKNSFSRISGITILFFSTITFLYPFVSLYPWFNPWGYMILGMTGMLMGIFLIQIHFQKQKDDYLVVQTKLQYLVHHDPLTKVLNRSYIDDSFKKIMNNNEVNVGLLFIDLNNFKQVNDEYGHRKGDEVLISFGKVLRVLCEPKGLVCRFGGDEFLVIFYNINEKEISNIQDKISEYGKSNLINNVKVTFAVGASIRKTKDEDIFDLLDIAEKQMYSKKSLDKSD
jgi:diguanylate cyclase (GGDEF)-like protein